MTRLAESARAGTLKPEELRGGTFTVTSAGKLGGLLVTPLVNHPEVGILGLHRIGPRPVVRDGEIVVRQIGNVSVTFDHRVVDGARAAAFTLDVIARLESGLLLLVVPSADDAAAATAAVVELRSDLAAGPLRAVHVGVGVAGAHRRQDLGEVARLRSPGRRRWGPTVAPARSRRPHVMSPSTVPPGDGQVGVLATGDWTFAVSQSQNEMPPLIAGFPKWTCDWVTAPSRPE